MDGKHKWEVHSAPQQLFLWAQLVIGTIIPFASVEGNNCRDDMRKIPP